MGGLDPMEHTYGRCYHFSPGQEYLLALKRYEERPEHWYKNPNRKTCPTISLGTCEYVKIGTETQKIKPGEGGLKDMTDKMESVSGVVEGTSGGQQ